MGLGRNDAAKLVFRIFKPTCRQQMISVVVSQLGRLWSDSNGTAVRRVGFLKPFLLVKDYA